MIGKSAERIFYALVAAGMTEAGAAGMIGNGDEESGCEACRVQGDFDPYRTASKRYARQVDEGIITLYQFTKDQKGWGIWQITYPTRKANEWEYAHKHGLSIADERMQIDFAIWELKNEYNGLWRYLCTTNDVYGATNRVAREFERPAGIDIPSTAIKIVDRRYIPAQKAYNAFHGKSPQPEKPAEPEMEKYWPPRTLTVAMEGPDVLVWQGLLIAYGLITDATGSFSQNDRVQTIELQKRLGVTPDGMPGPITWKAAVKI